MFSSYPSSSELLLTQFMEIDPNLETFVLDNFEQLKWLLSAAGAQEQLADLQGLITEIYADSAGTAGALAVLSDIRDVFASLPIHKPLRMDNAPPDLDACVRWMGARLDEILHDQEMT